MTTVALLALSAGAAELLGAELATHLQLPHVTLQGPDLPELPEEGAVLSVNAAHLRVQQSWPADCLRIWLDTPAGTQPGQQERQALLAPLAASQADYRVDCGGPLSESRERLFALMDALGISGAQRRLQQLRLALNEIDAQLMDTLRRRMLVCDEVGALKHRHNMPIVQAAREDEVLRRAAERVGAPYESAARAVTRSLMEQCKLRQLEVAEQLG